MSVVVALPAGTLHRIGKRLLQLLGPSHRLATKQPTPTQRDPVIPAVDARNGKPLAIVFDWPCCTPCADQASSDRYSAVGYLRIRECWHRRSMSCSCHAGRRPSLILGAPIFSRIE